MPTSYPTPVGANPTGGPILPGQNLDNPTNVPTKAPAVSATAVNQPPVTPTTQPSTPTAVVSSGTAANHVNNTIVPAMKQGQADIQAGITAAQAQAQKIQDEITANKQAADKIPPPVPPTPEQQIADTPDPGHQWIYDAQGNKTQIPVGSQIPPNYSTTNPTVAPTTPVTDSVTDPTGNKYVQFSDGTYGKYNALGQYTGTTTADDFTHNKNGQSIINNLNQLVNGTYPLTASQQAQVDGMKAQFQQLIDQQKVANANFTGGTTVAENLYGMGNSLTGLGEIKGTVDAGIAKIADLNGKMASAVAQMTASFQSDNLALMKTAYDIYSSAAKDRQTEIDNLNKAATDAQDKVDALKQHQQDQTNTTNNAADNDIRSLINEAGKGGATKDQIAQMQAALAKHDYAAAMTAAGTLLQDPTSPAGQYSAYLAKQKAAGKTAMSAGDFLAAQKYKDAYAAASASVAAQGAYTESDKNQSKLEHQLQASALSSRSDLGIQNKKVSSAIDLQKTIDMYRQADGSYKIPATNYGELVLGLAGLYSTTGVPSEGTRESITQATAVGDLAKAIGYATGATPTGTSQDVIKNLVASIQKIGETSEQLRNQEMTAQTPSDLDQSRVDHIMSNLPSYAKMQAGSPAYQTPVQINDTAVSALANVQKTNPDMLKEIHNKYPNMSAVDIAQKLGLMPTK